MFCLRNRIDPDDALWGMDMARMMQLMHADGISNGNRYVWTTHYNSPELEAIFESPKEPIDWKELDP